MKNMLTPRWGVLSGVCIRRALPYAMAEALSELYEND